MFKEQKYNTWIVLTKIGGQGKIFFFWKLGEKLSMRERKVKGCGAPAPSVLKIFHGSRPDSLDPSLRSDLLYGQTRENPYPLEPTGLEWV
jgi:hypothetical protein